MKIINNNEFFVQKKDLINLNKLNNIEIFSNLDDNDIFDFIKIDDLKYIDFINSYEFIMDYNELKDKSINELILLGKKVNNEIIEIEDEFLKGIKYLKMISIRDIIWYKQGILNIDNSLKLTRNNIFK